MNPADAVMSEEDISEAAAFACDFAAKANCAVAITGPIDIVADANRAFAVRNGSALQGRITGSGCMLSAITFDVQIDAETDCDLLLLPAVPFSRLMKNNIYLENFIYKRTTEHFSDVIAGIERTFFMTLTQRIAAFLLDEAADTGSDELALTQEAIARSIGSAREAVSRSLKKMNKDGSIQISRGSIRILDKRRLYEMMNTF